MILLGALEYRAMVAGDVGLHSAPLMITVVT